MKFPRLLVATALTAFPVKPVLAQSPTEHSPTDTAPRQDRPAEGPPAEPRAPLQPTSAEGPARAEMGPAPAPPAPASLRLETPPPFFENPSALRARAQWWHDRDKKLSHMTVGLAVASALTGVLAAGLVLGADRAATPEARGALRGIGFTFGGGAVMTVLGTVISGVTWGNHRNHKGAHVFHRHVLEDPI